MGDLIMKYFKAENGIVIHVICNPRKGFTETNENVVPGMLFDNGVFTTPEPEGQSIQQQIEDLESSITKRNLHGYNTADQYAIDKIDGVYAAIELLRAKAKAKAKAKASESSESSE